MSQETTVVVAFGIKLPNSVSTSRIEEALAQTTELEHVSAGNAFTGRHEHMIAAKGTIFRTELEGFSALRNLAPRGFSQLMEIGKTLGLENVEPRWFVGISVW